MIRTQTFPRESVALLLIELGNEPLAPSALAAINPPERLLVAAQGGLIVSGRAPVWLYAYLVHWAHPFAWVATHDPRLGGAVVVARHAPSAPAIGEVVPMPPGSEPGGAGPEKEKP